MNLTIRPLSAAAILACIAPALAQSGPEWEFYEHTFMRTDLVESMTTNASVVAIDRVSSSKVVCTFKANNGKGVNGLTEWKWEWNEPGRPIPLCAGQKDVEITVDAGGRVRRINWVGCVVFMRKRDTDRQIEYLIATDFRSQNQFEEPKPGPPYVRIWPNFAGIIASPYSADVLWNDRFGLSVALWEAGAGVNEKELEQTRLKGVTAANDGSTQILAGRDGWRKVEMSDLDKPNLVPSEQHYTGLDILIRRE